MTTEHLHPHHESHDYVAANQQFFDGRAETMDEFPGAKEMAKRVVRAMVSKYPPLFNEDTTTAMDYACGNGLISRELCPHVKSIVGVDISQGVVDQYNLRASNQGLEPTEMKAIRAELKGEDTELDGTKFDIIVCSAAYHHFPSVDDTTRILTSFLKPGGSLLVADLMKKDDGREIFAKDHHHVVAHTAGFGEEDMRQIFTKAGLVNFDFSHITAVKLHGNDMDVFLARGVKPVQ